MPEQEPEENEEEITLSGRQIILAALAGCVVMYFSATATLFFQKPPEQRSIVQLVYPFDHGPSAKKLHQMGVKKFHNEQYREALGLFGRSLKKDSDNAKALFLLASTDAKLGNFERALSQLETLETRGYDHPRVPIKKAYWLLGLGRYEEARSAARDFLDRSSPPDKNKFFGYMVLYVISQIQGETESAREIQSEINALELKAERWPMHLYTRLVNNTGKNKEGSENRAHETEFRAWRAMMAWAENEDATAREHRNWVVREGDTTVYEYDLMLATRSSELFGTIY